jgi:hypothetical protein
LTGPFIMNGKLAHLAASSMRPVHIAVKRAKEAGTY